MRSLSLIIIAVLALVPAARGNELQSRIDAAAAGATLLLSPGIHPGGIRITKPLRLIGQSGAIIDGEGKGDVVIVEAENCELRNLEIRNSGDSLDFENTGVRVLRNNTVIDGNRLDNVLFGIDVKSASGCRISGNYMSGKAFDIARRGDALRLFRSNNCLLENNTIENGRDALLWYSNNVTVRHNTSHHNRYGFHMMYANDVTLEDNVVSDNSVGIYLMYGRKYVLRANEFLRNRGPSGYGLGMKEIDSFTVESNVFSGNRVGCYIDGSPYTRKPGSAVFTHNTFACNDVGMTMLPAVRGNRIIENNFVDNIEQVAVQGRGAITGNDFALNGRGNFWSDYVGFDANHDGVGDQPYRARQLFESLIDREPKLRLVLFSPAHNAIEFMARAMPAVQPEPKFADPAPLMRPVTIDADGAGPQHPQSDSRNLLAAAAGLVALAAAVAIFAFPRFEGEA